MWQAYIEHSRAKTLVDTGINPKTDMLPGFGRAVHQNEDQRIENQLAQIGVTTDEIDIVINTHLHYDHTAANHLFKKAVFIVQKAEMRYAYAPEWYEASYYQPINHFDIPDLDYKCIFRCMVDTDSDGCWTPIPVHGGQPGEQLRRT